MTQTRTERGQRGQAVLLLAFMIPALAGSVALAIDIGSIYQTKRRIQTAADAGAMAAAQELKRGSNDTRLTQAVLADIATNGFTAGGANTVTVHHPPTTGAQKGDTNYVEVLVQQAAPTFFMKFVNVQSANVLARSVAGLVGGSGGCIYAGTMSLSGGSTATLDCAAFINSTASNALATSGGSCITATNIKVAGGTSGSCMSPAPQTGQSLAADEVDPMSTLQPPSYGACDYASNVKVSSGTKTLNPGYYCKGITITGGHVTFSPGIYVVGGALTASSGSTTLDGTGVSFYITKSSSGKWYTPMNFSGGGTYNLSAPTSGPMKGVLFFSDRSMPAGFKPTVSGGGDSAFNGALYFPGQDLVYSGGSSLVTPPCTILNARSVTLSGGSAKTSLSSASCNGIAVATIKKPAVVE